MDVRLKALLWIVMLICVCPVSNAYAKEDKPELPVIAAWSDGNGYTQDGTLICGTWAYDSVNPAGKYVLFGEDGTLLKRADQWENRDDLSENYTDTENETALVALRAEIFPGFEGIVQMVLEEKSGMEWTCELTAENQYGYNASVSRGEYILKEAEAYDGEFAYQVIYSTEPFQIQGTELAVINIQVLEEKTGETEVAGTQEEIKNRVAANGHTERKLKAQAEDVTAIEADTGNNEKMEQGRKNVTVEEKRAGNIWLLYGVAIVICVTGYFVLRNRKNTYQ